MADVIFGENTPGGKLPYSVPRHSGQIPVYYAAKNGSGYRRTSEGDDSGYLDMPSTPLFAFGRGLSYTSFAYSDVTLGASRSPSTARSPSRSTSPTPANALETRSCNSISTIVPPA